MTPAGKSECARIAVVSGAAGGLGSALCRLLVSQGWTVLGMDHSSARLEALSLELPRGLFIPLEFDFRDKGAGQKAAEALKGGPPPRALVCAAAVSIGEEIRGLSDQDWEDSFKINVSHAMELARALVPGMISLGKGAIVNVGSQVGIVGARKPSYAASKAALLGLTMSLARNLGKHGIRANLFLPGPMITPLTADWTKDKRAAVAAQSFLKRLCEPEEAARSIAFLLSEDASCITGAVLDATAGSMFGH